MRQVKQTTGVIALLMIALALTGCPENNSNNYTPTRDCPGASDPKAKC